MTPEEYTSKLLELAAGNDSNYATFYTASHAKIVIDAMCRYAKTEITITSGTLEEALYKDALNDVAPGVEVRIIITRYGPHWDVPEDIEIRYIDEPDEKDIMTVDCSNFKYELKSSEEIYGNLDEFRVNGSAGFRKNENASVMYSKFANLWEKSTPIIR